jgi:hypothetical protein
MTEAWRQVFAQLPSKARVYPKECSRFVKVLGWLQPWNRARWPGVTVTVGFTIYMPVKMIGTDDGAMILAHEAQHVIDADRFTRVGFVLLYLFALPTMLTMRAWFEARAIEAQARAMVDVYGEGATPEYVERWAADRADLFSGSMDLWMAPWARRGLQRRFMLAAAEQHRAVGRAGTSVRIINLAVSAL